MQNPFASPTADLQPAGDTLSGELSESRRRYLQIGEAFVQWEKLRIVYNLILAPVALVAALGIEAKMLLDLNVLVSMLLAGAGANVCFFAGHIVDCYATWMFGPLPWLRPALFFLGTLGSLLLVLVVVVGLSGLGFFDPDFVP